MNNKNMHKPFTRVVPNAAGRYSIEIVIDQMITRIGGVSFKTEEKAKDFAKEISFGKYGKKNVGQRSVT